MLAVQASESGTVKISPLIMEAVADAIRVAITYEQLTGRKLGITGEVAEVLVAKALGLSLLADSINTGYDAEDEKGQTYQIKATRKIKNLHIGRIGTIANHPFDVLVVALMDASYVIKELYSLSYAIAEPLAARHGRRNPTIREVINAGKRIW